MKKNFFIYFLKKSLLGFYYYYFDLYCYFFPPTKANESDVKALHPLATAHRPKNHNKLDSHDGKHAKNALQQLRSMMPSRGNYMILIKNKSFLFYHYICSFNE